MAELIQVLFIDDDRDLLDFGKRFLELELECLVTTIDSAAAAINLLGERKFDAIISDYEMKKMNGIELLKKIREKGDTTPFIIFTGKGREEVVVEALNNGADFYLQKGGLPSAQFIELSNKIMYAIARKQAERDLIRKNEELRAAYEEIAAREKELRSNLDSLSRQGSVLREHEERLIMAQEIGHVGSWEYNLLTDQIWGSAEGFRIYGYPPVAGDIDIEKIEACIPERERVHQALVDLITRGSEYNLEFAINPVDGSPQKIIHSIARIEKDEEGKPLKVTGVIQDITDLKRYEDSLRETNAYLENLIHLANVPIIVWDPSFRITRLNQAFEHLTGRSADELLGKSLELLFPPFRIDRSMRLIQTTLDGVRLDTVELEILHADGSTRTILWNSSTVYSADGLYPVATIAQGLDITDRKRLEKERTEALGRIKQNLAKFSILNDEIRNPLTVIALHAEGISDTQIAYQIIRQTERIDDQIRQLDLRWMESEKVLGFLERHHQVSFKEQPSQTGLAEGENPSDPTEKNSSLLVQEVQAELFTILDSIDALVYVADMDTHELLFINRLGRRLFGEISGKKCYEVLQFHQDKECPFCTNSLLRDQPGLNGVYQWEFHNPANGSWYDCRDRAIRWVDGRIVKLEIATDISDRKQREEELQESEERLRQITEAISIVYYVHDRNSNLFMYASPAYETIWKRSRQELYRDPYSFIEAIHPDDHPRVMEAIRKEREENQYIDTEYRIIQPDGTVRWIHSRNFPILNEQGIAYRVAGFAEDISEQKKVQEELLIHSQIVQNMAEGVVMVRAGDEEILYANPRFEQMFGYGPNELNGKNISIINAPTERSPRAVSDEIVNCLKQSGVWSGEVYNIRKDGTTFWCSAYVSTFHHYIHGQVWITVQEDITERTLSEKTLRESEEKYRTLAENVHDGIYIYQGDTFVFVNNRVIEITGYSREELSTMNLSDLVEPDDQERVKKIMMDRHAGNPVPRTYESRIITKNGAKKYVELAVSVISYNGEFAALGAARDITDQKKTEETLRENKERYQKLVQNIPDYIIVHRNGEILFVNAAATTTFGYTEQELVGSNLMNYLTPESQELVREMIKIRISGEKPPTYEITILTRDGQKRITEVNGVLIQYEGGPASLNVLTDITERKRDEEKLRKTSTELEQIFRHMINAFIIWESVFDENGKYVSFRFGHFNDAYAEISKLRYEDVKGKDVFEVWPTTEQSWVEAYGRVALTGIPYVFEMYHEPTKGWYHCNAYRPADSPDQVCVIFEDITDRRHAEDALRQTNKKLNLLYDITRHDINNQLSVLDGCVGLIRQINPTPSVDTYLSRIESVINQITHMIRFTREYEDIGVHTPVWQNLRNLVQNAGNSVSPSQTRFENDIPANREIFADPLIIKVFFNLIENALRHGGGISTIRFSLDEDDRNLILVYTDDGRGVPGVDKEKIFYRGFGKNTGFGLYISREILEITGITITESGEPGKGARFEIVVPEGQHRVTRQKSE